MPASFEAAGYTVRPATSPQTHRLGGAARHPEHGHPRGALGRFAGNDSLSGHLRALGLLGNEHVPPHYLTGDVDQRLALLQGLMDSGGCGIISSVGRTELPGYGATR